MTLDKPVLDDLARKTGEDSWRRVKRSLDEMSARLGSSATEEQFQSGGHVAREVLISLAQSVFEPDRHLETGAEVPSRTDAKRMLDAVVAYELKGRSREVTRKYVKAVIDLAIELQHKRTATYRDAAVCSEAAASAVRSIALIVGQDITDFLAAGVGNERDLIRALNEFAAEEAKLQEHPGGRGSVGIWFSGMEETPAERRRSEERRQYEQALDEWKSRVRALLKERAEEFVADWDTVKPDKAGEQLRRIIQELRRRL